MRIQNKNILSMLTLGVSMLTASVAMAITTPGPAPLNPLYPPGIGFNPVVNYTLPNFAYSPNIRKFVDSLPGLGLANANNLGQYIPVANPDTTSYPGSDYYEIGLKAFTQKMHSDLAATPLRGYYQINTGTTGTTDNALKYLGAAVIAKRDRPVRFKFFNQLATGAGGNLPMPVDTTIMGAGAGPTAGQSYTQNRATVHLHGGNTPWISDGTPHQWLTPAGDPTVYKKGASFQNVPDMVSGPTSIINGVQVACAKTGGGCFTPTAGDGIGTYYYTNAQSSRLMFYHDHAYGITRLNVYAGEAAPYLVTDQVEEDLLVGTNLSGGNPAAKQILPDMGGVYHLGIPLVIQDKTFVNESATPPATAVGFPAATSGYVPTATTRSTDPLWYNYATPTTTTVAAGNLWIPHEYMPIENIFDPTGNTPNGRWDYAPFMNPPMIPTNLTLPSPTIIPEAFADSMVVNGAAFPYVKLAPDAYRFRILNACNDRSLNLQMYKADPLRINVTNGGSGYGTANFPVTINANGNTGTCTSATAVVSPGTITGFNIPSSQHYISPPVVNLSGGGGTCTSVYSTIISNSSGIIDITALGCTGFTGQPTITLSGGGGGTYTGPITANIIPAGTITGVNLVGCNNYDSNLPTPTVTFAGTGTGAAATAFVNTEVKMVDSVPNPAYTYWPSDGRDGGVPDPTQSAPPFIQIGNEGGLMAQAAVWVQTPIGFEQSRQSIPTLGVTSKTVLLMPAMRADVIIDLSAAKNGDTYIMYNDGPAPMPGFWPLNDFYTDDPDNTGVGAAPTTPPGFGPNTRTVMQIRITGTKTSAFTFNQAALITALPKAFAAAQDKPLVPQLAYNDAYPGFATFDTYAQNYYDTLNITGAATPISKIKTTAPGNGYGVAPTVTIVGGGMVTQATATAGLQPYGGLTLLTAGAGYTAPPVVTIGTPASSYTGAITPAPAGGRTPVTATVVATVSGGLVTALTVDEPGSYYNTNALDLKAIPTCTVAPPTGCTVNTTTCVAATCSSFIAVTGTVGSITVTAPGSYTGQPYVYLTGGAPGMGAAAKALVTGSLVFTGKNLTEGADPDFGRLDIRLGSTPNPLTPNVGNGQVVGLARYIDPPTEFLNDGEVILWRLTHLGVDSHAMHFHLFNMQVVNRVDWTNVVKPPYPDEIGWREVIRTNPMEDIIVAIQPRSMPLPFPIPQSNRLLDPTTAANSTTSFLPVAPPAGIAAVPQILNSMTNFGFEYVWHCHLLGHEENDMMRPMVLVAPTAAPVAPVLATPLSGNKITLNWSEAATFANAPSGFTVQRCSGSLTCTPAAMVPPVTITNSLARTYTDTTVGSGTIYRYNILAFNNASGTTPVASNIVTVTTASWATMVTPTNGSTLAASQIFTWTNAGASLYQVFAGSAPGLADLGFTPPSAALTSTLNGLPTNGSKVYVTLWSLSGVTWTPVSYTYTAFTAPLATPATMVTPTNNAVLTGATQTFTWTNSGASAYQVWLGTSSGNLDIGWFTPAVANGTTGTMAGIPVNGSTVYVRLWSQIGATWYFNDYTYQAFGATVAATMVGPTNLSVIAKTGQVFTWNNAGASAYQLWVGTTAGALDLGYFVPTPANGTSTTVTALLPANTVVYVTLYSQIGGIWSTNSYSYTTGP